MNKIIYTSLESRIRLKRKINYYSIKKKCLWARFNKSGKILLKRCKFCLLSQSDSGKEINLLISS
tara:strand:+ start:257 stop:451 length:195 start_codon:yes stop_codon:yes gene_type:complete